MAYPSDFLAAVEIVLMHQGKVLIARHAEDRVYAPGAWSLPAGKVHHTETPHAAAVRECAEETGVRAHIVRELGCRATHIRIRGQDAPRWFFTYLMAATSPHDPVSVTLSAEHSDYAWVDADSLQDAAYASLLTDHRNIILETALHRDEYDPVTSP